NGYHPELDEGYMEGAAQKCDIWKLLAK
ncbi:MAG: hypothetical protein JWP88_972, partial [Flaviaesturariibacter sp.]|nr:hypothetical protein [Flaviaesturariibacter sp.]